jgi:allantoinase
MPQILANVFHSAGGNRLQAVDIVFDEQIIDIHPIHQASLEWRDITDFAGLENIRLRLFANRVHPKSHSVIDGGGLLVMPGGIDAHVHFNTPGFEQREDFEHGSLAAAHGGVTTVIDMPCTSLPPVTSVSNLETKLAALRGRSHIDFALWGGVRGNDFTDPVTVREQIDKMAGVVGFKAYLTSGMDSFADLTPDQMLLVARWLRESGLPLAVHAEDKKLVASRQQFYQLHARRDWRAYCMSRDAEAEAEAIKTMISVAQKSGARIHIVHLSSADGLNLVRQAQDSGLQFTAETCPHYLYFTQHDFENPAISAYLKTAPPVKFAEDRTALWRGLSEDALAFVTTDHAGCDPQREKTGDNFWEIYGGIPGVQHRAPFLISEGFMKGRLTLEQTIRLLSSNVADYFRLSGKGSLFPGKDADFTLVNLWESEQAQAKNLLSKGRYTPFEGLKLDATIEQTWLRGRKIMDRSDPSVLADPGYGRFIRRSG